jgi:hypothetical protein
VWSGGRWLTAVGDTRRVRPPGRPPVAALPVRVGSGSVRPVGVVGRVASELSLMGCWGKRSAWLRDLCLPTIVYVYPGCSWSPDGGCRSRAADTVEHRAFRHWAVERFQRMPRIVGVSSECVSDQRISVTWNRLYHLELWNDPDLHGRWYSVLPSRDALRRGRARGEGRLPVERPGRCVEQVMSWLRATGRLVMVDGQVRVLEPEPQETGTDVETPSVNGLPTFGARAGAIRLEGGGLPSRLRRDHTVLWRLCETRGA